MIAGGVGEVLLNSEVAFGRLNGSMPQRNLDLLERGVTPVGESGEGSSQVVRRDFNADRAAVLLDDLENGLGGHAGADDANRPC